MKEFSRSTNTQHAYLLVTQWICSCGDCEKFSLKHFRANFFELKKNYHVINFRVGFYYRRDFQDKLLRDFQKHTYYYRWTYSEIKYSVEL